MVKKANIFFTVYWQPRKAYCILTPANSDIIEIIRSSSPILFFTDIDIEPAKTIHKSPFIASFFQKSKFISSGIELKFIKSNLAEYDQRRKPFEPGLSIIDVMMFNSKNKIQEMLADNEFI